MAYRSPLARLLLCCLLSWLSAALQVTPNSPCASQCIDSDALDASDPNSFNTRNADITCHDSHYRSSAAGIKWLNCMSCLQNSTFSQGNENDQMWFLYNMRYSLSYCIFGFPNATNASTSPCTTSFACGPLSGALEDDILSPQSSAQLDYCSVDNLTQHTTNPCSSCITAGGDSQYLANYLTALDAGCAQKPSPGHILGLNGSIFSPFAIGIIDPALLTMTTGSNSGSALSSTSVAAIITVTVVVLLIIAAFVFVRIKKRQNRRKRACYAARYKAWGGSSSSAMPQSPLSFQCRAQMGPASPKFFADKDDHSADHTTNSLCTKPSSRKPHKAISAFQPIAAVTESANDTAQPRRQPSTIPHQNPLSYHPSNHAVALHSLNTNAPPVPSYPTPTHASPLSGAQSRFSPDSYTPTSAVSTRSTAPLLPYVPAHHASVPSLQGGGGGGGPHSTTSPVASASPLLRGVASSRGRDAGRGDGTVSTPPQPPKSPRELIGVAVDGVEGLVKFRAPAAGKKKKESGSPVESRKVMSVFPPPPPPRR